MLARTINFFFFLKDISVGMGHYLTVALMYNSVTPPDDTVHLFCAYWPFGHHLLRPHG